jgi:hypothetical protein
METEASYELSIYNNSKWDIDSAYDEEEMAVFEARMIVEEAVFAGVRVVKVGGNEPGTPKSKVIFQKVDKAKIGKNIKAKRNSGDDSTSTGSNKTQDLKDFLITKSTGLTKRSFYLVLVLILGFALMVFVRANVKEFM